MICRIIVTSRTLRSCGSVMCQTLRQRPGAVDRRSLVELASHAGQRGEIDDHRGACVRPGRLEHERRHRRALRLQPRVGPEADPAEDRVEDARRAGVVERLPEQHRDDRRNHDRQVRKRAVDAADAPHLAHQHGRDERDRDSRRAGRAARTRAVFLTAIGSSGSCSTSRKLCEPDPASRGCTRFVCCSDMITVRTIGYHENAPKTRSIGSRKSSVVSPPPRTHVTGVRRHAVLRPLSGRRLLV